MKKTVLALLALCILYSVLSTGVHAQTFTFDKAYQDYQYNLTLYNQAFSDYQNAKNAYLANKTLPLKEEARQKTLAMLRARDQIFSVYLTSLRIKIVDDHGLSNDEKGSIFGKIDTEVSWYSQDRLKYSDGDSLETLFGRSEESKSRYKTDTSLVIDEALFDISLGQEIGLRLDHEEIYKTIRSLIDAGVASGKLTLNPFNHWLNDIDSTIQTLKQNETDARTEITKIYSSSYSPQGSYDSATEILSKSVSPLSQLNEFLKEVINYIKNQNG